MLDYVYNLYEETIDDILYDSPTLWMVEFYRHWCGDCMRAMPHWKALAENVKDWSPIVKIAVINCEDQAVSGRYRVSSELWTYSNNDNNDNNNRGKSKNYKFKFLFFSYLENNFLLAASSFYL